MPKKLWRRRLEQQERCIRVYGERNAILRAMGYPSYAAYIASDLWRSIRDRVLRRSPECFACGARATQVHHSRYARRDLDGTDLSCLFSVCVPCHNWSEFKSKGDHWKLDPLQATARLKSRRGERLGALRRAARAEVKR